MIIIGILFKKIMIFSEIVTDLQNQLKKDLAQIRFLLKKNPALGYARIVEIGKEVGKKYNIKLIVNFPKKGMIDEFDMYGKRDLSLIVDYDLKRFPIDREIIKQKAKEILGDVQTEDAYMYENKEGVRVFTDNWKIDILPHSVHIWTEFNENVTAFCNWLMENAYKMKNK
ncbi:hypothetical protein NZNM25_04290 [Nitrosopumilus zosterae]|uniref:Uncharacterized protein n=2 Tax=Nitrosopumilaceae TaxID=338190 RepID=A0A2S2KQA7_9ARCH|nr:MULTISPECIES: hypothetical protein [Nitrosopumilus]BDQ31431.1 hypothetical protein NZOSNM25_001549 [Nitrosopumilus zosterae]GBH33638.1 hypothetical protein NZNM25_04290 [Nitrosopumilus zosterae]